MALSLQRRKRSGSSEETEQARTSPRAPGRAADAVQVEELDLRFDCNIATISGRLGEGRELGIETKLCELGDEALGSHFLGAAIEMIGTEILELGAVLEHVVDGREQ